MTEANFMRNVGTIEEPVSWLHERAVAMLYDMLTAPGKEQVRVSLTPGGKVSHDLKESVTRVKISDEWTAIGGVKPDLALYDSNDIPIRIIEVIVTSPPDKAKQEKLARLRKRGVDVVQVRVKTPKDLLKLCWVPMEPSFYTGEPEGPGPLTFNSMVDGVSSRMKHSAGNDTIVRLIDALQHCDPKHRRELLAVLNGMNTLDSLYPVSSRNPYRDKLCGQSNEEG